MGNAFACIKLGKASVDPREEHQTLDRVVERGIVGQILKSLEDSVSRRWSRHIAGILTPLARPRGFVDPRQGV